MNETTASSPVVPAAASVDDIEGLVRRSGTSFYWAMRFLPPEKRRAMFAVYAFCREVDDIADEPGPIDDKRRALQAWREEIDRALRSLSEEQRQSYGMASTGA